MATKVAKDPETDAASATTEEAVPRKSLLDPKKIKIAVLLLVVIAAQAAAMYLLLPPPAESTAKAGDAAGKEGDDDEGMTADGIATAEVTIDSFHSTNSRAAPGTDLQVTFKLVAVVSAENKIAFDEAANTLYKARIRESVNKVVRSSSLDDLNDPALSTMKRLIREEINKILRKSYVTEVVISEFTQMNQ